MSNTITPTVFYRTLNVEGLEIFYREAGPRDAPAVLLLHGFPSSSHMFRNLIPMLADKYHVVAPDFPGYGESSAPSVNDFDYSFERLATVTEKFTEKLNLSSYALYLSDIGASVGFRLAVMHPERVTAMIVQNGDAHVEAINKEFSKVKVSTKCPALNHRVSENASDKEPASLLAVFVVDTNDNPLTTPDQK